MPWQTLLPSLSVANKRQNTTEISHLQLPLSAKTLARSIFSMIPPPSKAFTETDVFLITKQNNSCPGGSPACQGRRAVAQTSPESKEEHFHTWLPAWHSRFAAPAHSPVPSRVPARGDPHASPWSLLSRPAHRSFPRSTRNSASSLSLNAQPCHSKQALLFISCLGFKTLCFSADHFPPVNTLISGQH